MAKYVCCFGCAWFWPQRLGGRASGKCLKTGKLITQTVRKCKHYKPKKVIE